MIDVGDVLEPQFELLDRPTKIPVFGCFFAIPYDQQPQHKYAVISVANGVFELYATLRYLRDAEKLVKRVRIDHPNTLAFSLFVVETNQLLNIANFEAI